MQIDTAGTYTLKYTAEDACGNVTEATREVVAEVPPTYRTVLYTDGTFIINESSRDQAANEALHGVATNVYNPFNPNGELASWDKYIFTNGSQRQWHLEKNNIIRVEVGSPCSPISLAYWFDDCNALVDADLKNLDTSNVEDFSSLFQTCAALENLDISSFNTSNAVNMQNMFSGCRKIIPDVTHFDTQKVQTMDSMFQQVGNRLTAPLTLDLSSFDTANVTGITNVFSNMWNVKTILASSAFVLPNIAPTTNMFYGCDALVGGAGTANATARNNTALYARIDNPPDAPGYFTLKSA